MPTYEYDLFISHAFEDKREIVDELAYLLMKSGIKVWYSGFELQVGNSLYESINDGLKKSRFGLVILSPTFFQKHWTMKELYTLIAQETGKKEKRILPIWHKIEYHTLLNEHPLLADTYGLNSSRGFAVLVNEIKRKVEAERKKYAGLGGDENKNLNGKALKVFIGHHPDDDGYRSLLKRHLTSFEKSGKIQIWDSTMVLPGSLRQAEIEKRLINSDLMIILLSADFVASDLLYNLLEMARARHLRNQGSLLPVIIRPLIISELPIRRFDMLPSNKRAISLWPDKDAAWLDVVQGVKKMINHLKDSK